MHRCLSTSSAVRRRFTSRCPLVVPGSKCYNIVLHLWSVVCLDANLQIHHRAPRLVDHSPPLGESPCLNRIPPSPLYPHHTVPRRRRSDLLNLLYPRQPTSTRSVIGRWATTASLTSLATAPVPASMTNSTPLMRPEVAREAQRVFGYPTGRCVVPAGSDTGKSWNWAAPLL